MCTEPNGNLHWSLSLSSMNTSTQFCTSHFFLGLCLGVCQCKDTIRQECIPVGYVLSAAVAMSIPECTGQGVCIPACTWQGVCVSQHALGRGVSAQVGVSKGGCVSQHALGQTPPTVNRMTGRCKNITLPQLHCGR